MFDFLINFISILRIGLIILTSNLLLPFLKIVYHQNNLIKKQLAIKELGSRLNIALELMGPSFIKLGQTLSTRSDFIGETLSDSLSELQDNVRPFAFNEVRKAIMREFKNDINNLYSSFDEKPVAAASIAQVHKAITHEGEIVAVKVLRPNIAKKFARDIKLFYFLVRVATFLMPKLKRLKPREVIDNFAAITKIELDLTLEAASAEQLRENCADDENIYIPQIYWHLTSKCVMTQEWVEGISIHDIDKLIVSGFDPHAIAQRLAVSFFNQAYRDGFFHADIHPGNILVDNEGRIVLIDFGIMGSLEHTDRIFVAKVLHGFISRDYKAVADIHFELGYVPQTQSRELFTLACRSVGEPIVGVPVNKISIGKLLKQLFDMSHQFEMNIQPKFMLLQKTLITVEGTGSKLYPEVNMWKLAEPWIQEWARQNFGFRAKAKEIKDDVKHFAQSLPKLIDQMNALMYRLEKSERGNSKNNVIILQAKRISRPAKITMVFIICLTTLILLKGFL